MYLYHGYPQNCQTEKGGKEDLHNKIAKSWSQLHFISIQIALRYLSTDCILFKILYLRHNVRTGADQIILLEGTWEATVKQMKLKVLCVIVGQCRPPLFSDVKDHSESKHLSPSPTQSSQKIQIDLQAELSPSQQRPRQCQAR